MKIAVIIGNGLVFDLLSWAGIDLSDWHPGNPSRWPSQPLHEGLPLLEVMPRLKTFFERQRATNPALNDFEIFDAILQRPPPSQSASHQQKFEHDLLYDEARHYLVGALRHFHMTHVEALPLKFWPWSRFFKRHLGEVILATSFNYDLVFETAFQCAGGRVERIGVQRAPTGGLPLLKPHGSIDFRGIGIRAPVGYPLANLFFHNDMPVEIIEIDDKPRLEAEIVLPAYSSHMRQFQWVAPGYTKWHELSKGVTDLVLLGLSYWSVDRQELDELTDAIPQGARIHMCNPQPNEYWMQRLKVRFGDDAVLLHRGVPQLW